MVVQSQRGESISIALAGRFAFWSMGNGMRGIAVNFAAEHSVRRRPNDHHLLRLWPAGWQGVVASLYREGVLSAAKGEK